jgi:hypothetical protein
MEAISSQAFRSSINKVNEIKKKKKFAGTLEAFGRHQVFLLVRGHAIGVIRDWTHRYKLGAGGGGASRDLPPLIFQENKIKMKKKRICLQQILILFRILEDHEETVSNGFNVCVMCKSVTTLSRCPFPFRKLGVSHSL